MEMARHALLLHKKPTSDPTKQSGEKLDSNPTKSWHYQLCVPVYMLFHDSLYLPY